MDFIFAFKKILSRLLFPVPLIYYPLAFGLFLIWFGKTERMRKIGRIAVTISFGLLTIFSVGPLSNRMLASLEWQYRPFRAEDQDPAWKPAFIVVLAGDHVVDPELPAVTRVGFRTMARLSEGVRLKKQVFPESKLIVTGGKFWEQQTFTVADDMAVLAEMWGVDPSEIIIEDQSKDTKDHVFYLRETLEGEDFVLVTSAAHLPRAMALFEHSGLKPVAAPVTYYSGLPSQKIQFSWGFFLPRQSNLYRAESAFYEYMGLAWAKLRGQI